MTIKYTGSSHTIHTKWPQNGQNGHKIYQHRPLQDLRKFTQIGIFGLKKDHLATLVHGRSRTFYNCERKREAKRTEQFIFFRPKLVPKKCNRI
jgi:hypothetical protein